MILNPLLGLALLLFGAKVGGILLGKLKQPSVIGELVAGIVLGPSLLALVDPTNEFIMIIKELGLLFMILLVSLTIDWKILEGRAEKFSWMELTRVILVVAAVYFISIVLGWDIYTTVVMGTVSRWTKSNRNALVDVRRWVMYILSSPPKNGSAHFGRVERKSEQDIRMMNVRQKIAGTFFRIPRG